MAKTCFVIMGFHKRTDYPTGRTLDLDKSYRLLVKPSVDECGLRCVRADEITHSGVIDVPMYQHLLDSDLVIADLSTSNANALYELGVRHALRPFSTIVIAESQLQYPFDIAHTAIRSYQHLGDAIDYEEVIRFREELTRAIRAIVDKQERDSPVYTYLPTLKPPAQVGGRAAGRGSTKRGAAATAADGTAASPAALINEADDAIARKDFVAARASLSAAHSMRPAGRPWTASDDYVLQRLAWATAMSAVPSAASALADAQALIQPLQPGTSNNPETVELWGAIARGLWDHTGDKAHLDAALLAYERRFCLRHDLRSGLDYALLLNVRASSAGPAEAIADFVQARRIRLRVAGICTAIVAGEDALRDTGTGDDARRRRSAVRAALAEAWLGLDNPAESDRWQREAAGSSASHPDVLNEMTERLAKLNALLEHSPLRYLAV